MGLTLIKFVFSIGGQAVNLPPPRKSVTSLLSYHVNHLRNDLFLLLVFMYKSIYIWYLQHSKIPVFWISYNFNTF